MSINEKSNILDITPIFLIPELLEEIRLLKKEIAIIKDAVAPALDLTKPKGVTAFLEISYSTLSKKIKEGEFKKGVHYTQDKIGENKKYIPEAIKQYKEKNSRFKVKYSAMQSAIKG